MEAHIVPDLRGRRSAQSRGAGLGNMSLTPCVQSVIIFLRACYEQYEYGKKGKDRYQKDPLKARKEEV